MADQVSALLQLVLQETGNNNNNWGVILNQQFQKLEDAAAGQSILTVSGGTKALTDDEQRPKVLLVTGNLTSDAFIEVKPHLANWIIHNATTGDFTVSVRTPSNPAYMLPRSQSEAIWCDGVTIRPVGENGKVPVGGFVWSFRTVNVPVVNPFEPGFLEANGQAVSRTLYRRLYEVYGTVHGGGDGSTTFNLPNVVGRYVRGRGGNAGSVIGALQDDMVKTHTHTASSAADGAHQHSGTTAANGSHNHSYTRASNSNQVSGLQTGSDNSVDESATTSTNGNHTHIFTTDLGGAHSHAITVNANEGVENRPLSIVAVPLVRFQ